jgi:hypothetical protein
VTDKVIVNEQSEVLVDSGDVSVVVTTGQDPHVVGQVEQAVDVVEIRSTGTVLVEQAQTIVVAAGSQGPAGPPGAAGAPAIEMNFAFGDASPAVITLAEAGKVIYNVNLHITVPFDGAGASLTVGDAAEPDRFMKAYENDPTQVGSNETNPAYQYGVGTQVILTIMPGGGASQGAGLVTFVIQQ